MKLTLTTYDAKTNRYCVDAYAWIEYFDGSTKGSIVAEIIENDGNEIFVPVIAIAEVINAVKKRNRDVDTAFNKLLTLARMAEATPQVAKETGLLYHELRQKVRDFPLADAFLLATARQLNAKIITGDKHFAKMKNVVFLS